MANDAHDLQLTVLQCPSALACPDKGCRAHLESFVLKDALDGSIFPRRREFRLKNDAKRAIADNLALRVLHIPRLAGDTILDLFANDL